MTDRIFGWQGDIGPAGQSVPLRLAGGLHALFLSGHAGLAKTYPPSRVDDKTLWQSVCDALVNDAAFLMNWLNSAPQTNEVRRAAVLIAVGQLLAHRFDLPIRTSELGASAGLNLHWDSYALQVNGAHFGPDTPALTLTPEWKGPLPPHATVRLLSRRGVDLNPLDADQDGLRLRAYLWPDQPHRMALTDAAIKAARTPVAQGDAIDWLAGQLDHQPGQLHLIYSTVAWQYFPTDKQAKGAAMIAQAGSTARPDTPLAWFGMENDKSGKGAALTLRLWPGNHHFNLGRADFHGRWIKWTPPQA